jgi:hypothetical protein
MQFLDESKSESVVLTLLNNITDCDHKEVEIPLKLRRKLLLILENE